MPTAPPLALLLANQVLRAGLRREALAAHPDYPLHNLVVLLLYLGHLAQPISLPGPQIYGKVVLLLSALDYKLALAPADLA